MFSYLLIGIFKFFFFVLSFVKTIRTRDRHNDDHDDRIKFNNDVSLGVRRVYIANSDAGP